MCTHVCVWVGVFAVYGCGATFTDGVQRLIWQRAWCFSETMSSPWTKVYYLDEKGVGFGVGGGWRSWLGWDLRFHLPATTSSNHWPPTTVGEIFGCLWLDFFKLPDGFSPTTIKSTTILRDSITSNRKIMCFFSPWWPAESESCLWRQAAFKWPNLNLQRNTWLDADVICFFNHKQKDEATNKMVCHIVTLTNQDTNRSLDWNLIALWR